jgi:hypothetical protein
MTPEQATEKLLNAVGTSLRHYMPASKEKALVAMAL